MVDEEKTGLLEIYKTLKEKGLLKEENTEYEEMLKEDKHKEEFREWHNGLSEKDKKDFDYMFGE